MLRGTDFAVVLKNTTLRGESSSTSGLHRVWGCVESTIHDVAHMVVLGKPIAVPHQLAYFVNETLCRLPRHRRDRNETKTLAAQVLFMRKIGAFNDKEGGEERWLTSITCVLPDAITPEAVSKDTERDDVQRFARLLERRLRYHCWASVTPRGRKLLKELSA